MLFYRLLYVMVQIGLPLTADQYVGVCGSNAAEKHCFALSTLAGNGTNDVSKTFLINDTYKNIVCPTNVRTAVSFPIPSEFDIYPFELQCSDATISVFIPQNKMSYALRPFHEVSGTTFSLLTECNTPSCRCIVINVNVTDVHIHTTPSGGAPKIETIPTRMTKINQTFTMNNPLEMIVVTGHQSELAKTYVSSNDSVTVFCLADGDHATRGILQLPPLAFPTTPTTMVQIQPPSGSSTIYQRILRQSSPYQAERYIVRIHQNGTIDLSGFAQVPSDWYVYVPDVNASFNYHLLGVAWSNVSGSSLNLHEAERYKYFTFRKVEFVYRNLTMSLTTSATESSTKYTSTVSNTTPSATSPTTTSYTKTITDTTPSATSPTTTSYTSTVTNTTPSATSPTTTSYTSTVTNTTPSATSPTTTSYTSTVTNTTPSATSPATTSYTSTVSNTTPSATSPTTTSYTKTVTDATPSATSPATTTEQRIPSPAAVSNASAIPPDSVNWPYTYTVGMCTYRCDSPVLPVNINDPVQRQMLQKQLKELRKQLTVNKTGLSSTKRRKESAIDQRMSAKAFGLVGTAMLCTCIGVIILADLPKLSKIIRDFRARVCKPDTIPVKKSKMRRPSRVRKQSESKLVPFIRNNRISSDTSV